MASLKASLPSRSQSYQSLSDADLSSRLEHWRTRLAGTADLLLPTDYPRPLPMRVIEATETHQLSEMTSLAILQLSLSLNVPSHDTGVVTNGTANGNLNGLARHPTPFTILLTAFAILLQRFTGDDDFIVGSSSDSRNLLLLRLAIDPSQSFSHAVQTISETEHSAAEDEVSFHTLLSYLQPQTKKNQQPLFRVRFFNRTDTPTDQLLETTTSTTDLTISITSHTSSSLRANLLPSIEISVSYNQVLFSSRRIQIMLEQLSQIIETVMRDPHELPVGKISLATPSQMAVLPDPTSNLHWSAWRGAIHDVFARNARTHPDRPCVIESLDENTGYNSNTSNNKLVYTYQHIHEASNLVAHYLMANGVNREDVVTIYAYRGVDLVVAIMGTLKAGATYSVIDPAYPPTRQQIYLDVATPAALIMIAQAGRLSPSVRQHIVDNLNVVCEIPALSIQPGGHLLGGPLADGNGDIFDQHRQLAPTNPDVIIGPDSIGTLSFTSGSTGIPKGVRGRHFALTHYYPWMAEEFGISNADKFTMLSGIAHDPIQRDIFTPLFFGAELHVPTSEDIGIPGQLAQWMRDSAVTITHLTPAMGQLLSSHATTQISSLKSAFFVGDILTKRDVSRLQKIAPNVQIINMYGTTETQRAVSYYTIPPLAKHPAFLGSQKEVIPAGRGMHNVQLLVVNRHDRSVRCGVGEVGEIYVRAAGLAEGYLRLPDATAEKFLINWFTGFPSETLNESEVGNDDWKQFWKGPRDRVYRTGDLGRYRPDGAVECTGRADDQVKIRGFRIELGEIDTHLSQHPLVRENVTLVRRDKYEEQTLVSYFVPVQDDKTILGFLSATDDEEENESAAQGLRAKRKFRRLVRDIREWLKQKLPSYAVPTVFVPLVRMPLTPNGKIDKHALPFPDTAQFNNASGDSKQQQRQQQQQPLADLTPTERIIHDIWLELLSLASGSHIPLTESFFDLGGHSILATRLIFEVRKRCQVNAPLGLVFKEPTISGLAREVDKFHEDVLLFDDKEEERKAEKKDENPKAATEDEFDYAADYERLKNEALAEQYEPLDITSNETNKDRTVLLTGATGFLGAFILSTILSNWDNVKVVCVVRAASDEAALKRVQQAALDHLVWKDEWAERVSAVCGDLGEDRLGISEDQWTRLAREVDIIIHNGAFVHWVYPYPNLRKSNVLSTIWVMRLAAETRPKSFHFISSTSMLDTEHYIRVSDSLVEKGKRGVLERDDLEGARHGLRSGYAQSKWVSEKLILEARRRGFPGTIIRPGYILGDSKTGVTNTDDFIWRLMKGCTELGYIPSISNVVNTCAVDYVASCVAEVALQPRSIELGVFHITHPANFTFDDLFSTLGRYGYQTSQTDYIDWRDRLMQYILAAGEKDNALYPLLHFVLDDLPTSTKAPRLNDDNTQAIIAPRGIKCPLMGENLIGIYLAYLIKVGFMERPPREGASDVLTLPSIKEEVRALARAGR